MVGIIFHLRNFALIFGLISGISAQNSDGGQSSETQDRFLPSESQRTVRVMVHKEFQLQRDGSYKEIPSESTKKVSSRSDDFGEDGAESVGAESVPSAQYYKASFSPYYREYMDGAKEDYRDYMTSDSILTPYVIKPQNAPLNRFRYGNQPSSSYDENDDDVVGYEAPKATYYPTTNYEQKGNESAPQATNNYDFNVQQGAAEYYVDDGQLRPLTSAEAYTVLNETQQPGQAGSEVKTHYTSPTSYNNIKATSFDYQPSTYTFSPQQSYVVMGGNQGQNQAGLASNIQEILNKQPAASQNNQYYSPKDSSYYDQPESDYGAPVNNGGYNQGTPYQAHVQSEFHSEVGNQAGFDVNNNGGGYVATGPSGGDGGYQQQGGYEEQGYGNQGGNDNNGWNNGNQGAKGGIVGTKAGIVGAIAKTVKGVGAQKGQVFQEVISQKGEVGSQLLKQGGYAVKAAVNTKAQKAKVIVNVLSEAPNRLASLFSTKANLASAALAHGGKKIGTIVSIKAQAANQASELIAAKGKAANAVIKASGGTAADLIIAKGKGLAHLIKSGGRTAAAVLNYKGAAVSQVANAIGSLGATKGQTGGYETHSEQYGGGGGYEGGYESQIVEQTPKPYDQLQFALKSVVESPASSYGSPPASHAKIQSAFESMFDNFKSGQGAPSTLGAYSAPVAVTAPASSEESGGASFKDSLTKMSEMFNNISNVFKRLSPTSKEQ